MTTVKQAAETINWVILENKQNFAKTLLREPFIKFSVSRIDENHALNIECGYQRGLADFIDFLSTNENLYKDDSEELTFKETEYNKFRDLKPSVMRETLAAAQELFDWFNNNETVHTLVCRHFATEGRERIEQILEGRPQATEQTVIEFNNIIVSYIESLRADRTIRI